MLQAKEYFLRYLYPKIYLNVTVITEKVFKIENLLEKNVGFQYLHYLLQDIS